MRFLQIFHNKRTFAQAALLLGGVLTLILGVVCGEVRTVLMKAIYICLECIGIG
ncbi:MAG: thioredoxin [Gracilibacteraceae bacterium]|jgi:hypothetical protein|nr:thioredoxin [Gracilibacteraceae bacterium]